MEFPLVAAVAAFVLGAVTGSFLNVCIYRMPLEQSVVSPGSRCMACGTPVRWFDNIPILSWVLLRGRCRSCAAPFSIRYPLVELLTGLLCLLLFRKFGLTLSFAVLFLLCASLLVVTFIDFDHQIIPDEITLPGIAIGLLCSFILPEPSWRSSLLGILVGWGSLALVFYGYLWLTGREGMGGGDAKLLAMIGAFLGLKAIPFVIFVSSLVGSLVGLSLMALQGRDRHLAIPFGPYLVAGAILYLFFGPQLISWYLHLGR
ncbi:prepilin peptidase [Trichlorobacter ammonificans]|uniref:Prepilin leader peptidase/N-methyltransferase n=1 Tax=Trichlorobacter ammonificans TaxID=2916410 RepID=A0ABN8HHR1_9BACT|nr:A24 family peptidase [Trichlorobacter ammonificans]CAH2030695.1 Leader peptidase (Prepilin peptidase) [Trichlorobacter ammonificans]